MHAADACEGPSCGIKKFGGGRAGINRLSVQNGGSSHHENFAIQE